MFVIEIKLYVFCTREVDLFGNMTCCIFCLFLCLMSRKKREVAAEIMVHMCNSVNFLNVLTFTGWLVLATCCGTV